MLQELTGLHLYTGGPEAVSHQLGSAIDETNEGDIDEETLPAGIVIPLGNFYVPDSTTSDDSVVPPGNVTTPDSATTAGKAISLGNVTPANRGTPAGSVEAPSNGTPAGGGTLPVADNGAPSGVVIPAVNQQAFFNEQDRGDTADGDEAAVTFTVGGATSGGNVASASQQLTIMVQVRSCYYVL